MIFWLIVIVVISFALGVIFGSFAKAEAYAVYEALGALEAEDAAKVMAILRKVSSKL